MRTAVSTSGPPVLLDDAIEAILATARSPRERDRRDMVDIAPVLRNCGLRRSEAAALVWSAIGRWDGSSGHLLTEGSTADQTGVGRGGVHHPPGHGRLGPDPAAPRQCESGRLRDDDQDGQTTRSRGGFGRAVLRPLQLSYEDVRLGAGCNITAACPLRWSFQPLSRAGFSLGTLDAKLSHDCWASIFSRLAEPPWNYMLVRYQLPWNSTATRISGSITFLIQG